MIYMARPICTNLLLLVDKYDSYPEEDREKIKNSGIYTLVDDSTSKCALRTGLVFDPVSDKTFEVSSVENEINANAIDSVNNVSSYETTDEDVKYTGYRYLHLLEGFVS